MHEVSSAKVLSFSINLSSNLAWNPVVTSGLVILTFTCTFWISYGNGCVGFWCYTAGSLKSLTHFQNIGFVLVDIRLNCLNWFNFLILVTVSHVISTGCMIFISLILDIKDLVSTVSFLLHLDTEFLACRMF